MSTGTLDGEMLRALQDESSLPRAMRGVASALVNQLQETLSGRHSSVSLVGFVDFRPSLEERKPANHSSRRQFTTRPESSDANLLIFENRLSS
jgi:hypothetical protein